MAYDENKWGFGTAIGIEVTRRGLPLIGDNVDLYPNFKNQIMNERRGRPKGAGGFLAADLPIVEKMREMITNNPGMTAFGAAGQLAEQAAGNASLERKQRRLAERYKDAYPD